MSENRSYYLQLHFIIFISSLIPSINRQISLSSVEIVFYRTFIAMVLLGGFLWVKKFPIRQEPRLVAEMLITGLITAVFWTLQAFSVKISNASVTLVGIATSPLWVSFISPIINHRKVDYYQILTGLCAMFGVYMVFSSSFEYGVGLIIAIVAAFFGALLTVLNSLFARTTNHYVVSFYQMGGAWIGTIMLFPFHHFMYGSHLNTPTLKDFGLIMFIAFASSIYAYSVLIKVMKKISPFTVVLVSNLTPVYGMVAALFIYGTSEMMTTYFYAGTLIILASVVAYPVMEWAGKQRQKMLAPKA